ncbi:MAG: SUMF1/EgtB/PvdO family nonheme iron enzyme [Elainellaceae cyanobacterium]
MNPNNVYLFNLFFGLRDDLGLPLQVEDYGLLVEAWDAGVQPNTYEELRGLCQRLWVKSPSDRQRFRDYFDSYIADYLSDLQDEIEEAIDAQARASAATETAAPDTGDFGSGEIAPDDRSQLQPAPSHPRSQLPVPAPRRRSRPNLQVVQAVPRDMPKSERVPVGKFSLSDEYFPVNRRELLHGWSRLRQRERSGWSREWDISATVERIGKQGSFLNDPVYQPAYQNRTDLILLVDRSNSMAPFDLMAERLVSTAQRAKKNKELNTVKTYYFRNYSEGKLYEDAEMWKSVWLDELLPELSEVHTVAVMFSDGGAARRGFSPERWEASEDFVTQLRGSVRQVAWLNPLPVERWQGTTAAAIAKTVPMFALDLMGWRTLLKDLRGQGQWSGAQGSLTPEPSWHPRNSKAQKNLRRQLKRLAKKTPDPERYDLAIEQMLYWAQKGEDSLDLLAHAAFPLALTPDLLYYLQENFVPDTPWMWAADLLLSSQSHTIGYHLYELDPHVRHLALRWLVQQDHLGTSRLKHLSDSLLFYVQHRLEGTTRRADDFGDPPEWIALAYTEPNELAKQIARRLKQALPDDVTTQVRLASLVSTLTEPIAEAKFEPLLHLEHLIRGTGRLARGDEARAEEMFAKIPAGQRSLVVDGVRLPIPGRVEPPDIKEFEFEVAKIAVGEPPVVPQGEAESPDVLLKTFEFETVKADNSGQIVERIAKTASGYVESLTPPPSVFVSYADEDEAYRNEIVAYLSQLQQRGVVSEWTDRPIQDSRPDEYTFKADRAHILLLLVSPAFMRMAHIWDRAIMELGDRQRMSDGVVIPVMLKPTNLGGTPIGEIQALPEDKTPISQAPDRELAFENVANGIEVVAQEIRECGVTLEMIYIPDGTFLMGSPESKREDRERPQHEVSMSGFFMGRYPVTQAQWKAAARLPQVEQELNSNPFRFKGDDRPAEKVSWHDAIEFCARLSQATGRDYRLPSEAEWEYTCRAESTTDYAFGDTITHELANYYGGDRPNETTPVGSFPPNAFGLYDMHSNVWEWCLDPWHGNYNNAPTDGRVWEEGGDRTYRVVRGGCCYNLPRNCRSAIRDYYLPDTRDTYNGFRVVCSAARTLP